MQVSDFHFDLPDELIARYPQPERTASRLLQMDGNTGELIDGTFTDVLEQVQAGDLVVFNNTRVIPARLFGRKESGGKLEVLVERMLDEKSILAHVRCSKSPKPGTTILVGENDEYSAQMVARHDALFELKFNSDKTVLEILEEIGHMPLPPYIDRQMKTRIKSVTKRFITKSQVRLQHQRRAFTLMMFYLRKSKQKAQSLRTSLCT